MLAKFGRTVLRPSRLAGLLLAALGIVFASGCVRLGLWVDGGPGPGLMPAVSSAALLVLLVPMLMEKPREDDVLCWEPLLAAALGGAFVILAPRIGIGLPAAVMIMLWVKVLHGQSWLRSLILGLSLTAVGLLIFHVALKVPMPILPGGL